MSLKIKFNTVQGDCTSLLVYDETGVYSNVIPLNLTGFGAPNPTVAMVDTATLTVTSAASTTPYTIDVYPTLPNTSDTPFELLPTAIGYTTSIPDQILTIKYGYSGIDGSGTPFTPNPVTCYVPILCSAECCVKKMLANAAKEVACSCDDICSCTCSNQGKTFKWYQANMLLQGIKELAANRQYWMAVNNLNLLKQICNCI